jgi:hypothetical protein
MTRGTRLLVFVALLAACGDEAPRSGGGEDCTGLSCNDGIECTVDRCEAGSCIHEAVHSRCAAGRICHPQDGCKAPPACTSAADCPEIGACSVPSCDSATGTCSYRDPDGDGDGHAPQSCGGADCNDASASVRPGADERCNAQDDDCDGAEDEGFGVGVPCDGPDGDSCPEGTTVCNAAGTDVECSDASGTTAETCDGTDDDCDGVTDEGSVCCGDGTCDSAAGEGCATCPADCGGPSCDCCAAHARPSA